MNNKLLILSFLILYTSVVIYLYCKKKYKIANILLISLLLIITIFYIHKYIKYCNDYVYYQYPKNLSINITPIPYIIYKTGPYKKNELPEEINNIFEKTISDNPKYTIKYFDDEESRNFIKNNFDNSVLNAYDRIIPGAYKADLFRYCILYIKGGVYSDLSQQFMTPLYTLIDHNYDKLVLVRDRYIGHDMGIQINFMAAIPNLSVYKKAIDQIVENVNNNYYGNSTLEPTGPLLFKQVLVKSDISYRLELEQIGSNLYNIKTKEKIIVMYSKNHRKDLKKKKNLYYHTLWREGNIYHKNINNIYPLSNTSDFKHLLLNSKGPFNTIYSQKNTVDIENTENIIKLIKNHNKVLWIRNVSLTPSENLLDYMYSIFYPNTDLDIFSNYLHLIKYPIILITTDGDRSIPGSVNKNTVNKILNCKNIKKWYTVNYDKTIIHDKLKPIPIGFNFHTSKWLINNSVDDKISFMKSCRQNTKIKIEDKIFSDSHNRLSHPERKEMFNILKNNKNINFLNESKNFKEITQLYNNYLFVLSPRGHGLDCHRTWELFMAGCIVITKTSSLDQMFIDNQLPVVILKDWNELNTNLQSKLKNWEKKLIHLTDVDIIYPKLTYGYWLK